jgi:hypothetical protein
VRTFQSRTYGAWASCGRDRLGRREGIAAHALERQRLDAVRMCRVEVRVLAVTESLREKSSVSSPDGAAGVDPRSPQTEAVAGPRIANRSSAVRSNSRTVAVARVIAGERAVRALGYEVTVDVDSRMASVLATPRAGILGSRGPRRRLRRP